MPPVWTPLPSSPSDDPIAAVDNMAIIQAMQVVTRINGGDTRAWPKPDTCKHITLTVLSGWQHNETSQVVH